MSVLFINRSQLERTAGNYKWRESHQNTMTAPLPPSHHEDELEEKSEGRNLPLVGSAESELAGGTGE